MASLFKRREANASGKKVLSSKWFGKYLDHDRNWKTTVLFTDRAASQQELQRLQRDAEQRRAGIRTPVMDNARKPIADHAREFAEDPARAALDNRHRLTVDAQIERCIGIGEWRYINDMTPDAVRVVMRGLAGQGLGIATRNRYLAALKAFAGWAVDHQRLAANPLTAVKMTDESPERKRILSAEDLRRLLDTAPEERARVYRFACMTGLRRSEIAGLRWSDLHLECTLPYVQLRKEATKNGRDDQLPLHPDVVAMLAEMRGMRTPAAAVFHRVPKMTTMRADLSAAGIEYETDAGVYSFHAMRLQFCDMVVKSGCSIKEAQSLMRHSDPKLTLNVYGRAGLFDLAGAMKNISLPTGPAEAQNSIRTGTDDIGGAPCAHQMAHHEARFSVLSHSQRCISDSAKTGANASMAVDDSDVDSRMDCGDMQSRSRACTPAERHYPQPDSNRCIQTENLMS